MRLTLQSWWCWRGHKNIPSDRRCHVCDTPRVEKHAQVHASERAVVYYNPLTGEHRTPPRSDTPIPEQYVRDGFERREIMNMTQWEKESGVVHEESTFNSGNAVVPDDTRDVVSTPPSVKQALIDDMRAAIASGPFTGGIPDSV